MKTIVFTKEKYEQLKSEYNRAVSESVTVFMFDDEYEMLTEYAKYLIQHLSSKFE